MTLPTNDDFANCELSIDELEAIAAGSWFSRAVHWVEHEAKAIVTSPAFAVAGAIFIGIGAIVTGAGGGGAGGNNMRMN